MRPDKMGRTPLCQAQAEQKQQWNEEKHGYMKGGWEVVESDKAFQDRQDTAKAMLEWIQKNDPDILDEVKTW